MADANSIDARSFRPSRNRKPSPEYVCWQNMRNRCRNPTHKSYPDYGGRGITICPRWNSFDVFLIDMGPRPGPGFSIERKDNNGPYSPDNCVWATRKKQQNNNRHVHWITFEGRTLSMLDWSKEKGLKPTTLITRLIRGWGLSRALTEPVQTRQRRAA